MSTKICLRSGMCCSEMMAVVPKYEDSNLSPAYIESLEPDDAMNYLDEHAELMGKPCKWLTRDLITTEATCKAHERKGLDCLNYPENYSPNPNQYCPVGLHYWRTRRDEQNRIPEWIENILSNVGIKKP